MKRKRSLILLDTVKPALSGHSKRSPKIVFKTNYCLMQVKSIAECSKGSIQQYFRPSFSYHLSLTSLFCLVLSDRSRQVLLYTETPFACCCPLQVSLNILNSGIILKTFTQIFIMSNHMGLEI